MYVAARTSLWVAAADPLGCNRLSQPSFLPHYEKGIQGGLTKRHACFRIALEANLHNFPITPPCGSEGRASPRIRDNSQQGDLPALLEPMKQRVPIRIFLCYLAKLAPFKTFIGQQAVL